MLSGTTENCCRMQSNFQAERQLVTCWYKRLFKVSFVHLDREKGVGIAHKGHDWTSSENKPRSLKQEHAAAAAAAHCTCSTDFQPVVWQSGGPIVIYIYYKLQ